MSKFFMTIGIPACGKSTWADDYASKHTDTIVVSSDNIRKELFGDINDQTHNDIVFSTMRKRTFDNLTNGIDVIYDATNINRKRRINFLKTLPKDTDRIGILFTTPFSDCIKRNNSRDRVVDIEVLTKFYKSFQMPYYSEGFDKIIIVSNTYDSKSATDELYSAYIDSLSISHDNPHHTATLGTHCANAYDYAKIIAKRDNLTDLDRYILSQSAIWHDIGKLKTKTFTDSKGVETSEAHYYNHDNISAYDYLSAYANASDTDSNTHLLIANLINLHMIFFSGDDAVNRMKKMFSSDFWRLLELLHECDINAD